MITHRLHVPSAPVAWHVEHLWLVRGTIPVASRQMLLPDGALVVIFNLGEPQKLCDRGDVRRREVFHASWVSGQQPQPIVIEQAGSYHLLGIRFRPAGAAALFRFSLAEVTGRVVELEDIWGRAAARLREQLHAAPGDREALRCLEGWLARSLRDAAPPDRRVDFAAEQLRRGGVGVGRIAEVAGISAKHLVHEFTRRVGLTPKHFGRVQRLQRTIRHIGFRPAVEWAEIALANGFYDQSHLSNEFRALAGISPAEYLARRSPYLGYLGVA